MSCKVAIVILHYESLQDTRECLNSLKKYLIGDRVQIIVVDNGSPNGKLISIQDEYNSSEQIHFILSEVNLGFAKGNNLGFIYAKRELCPDVIVLANNDLVFKQDDFIDILLQEKNNTRFDVAGPKILSLEDGKNQNPVGLVYRNSSEVSSRIKKFELLNMLSYFDLDLKFKMLFGKPIEEYEMKVDEDYQLHGACMFFANKYIEKFDGLYDGTFMYGEEFILKHIVNQEKMNMMYLSDLTVFHKEGASTKQMWGKGKKKRQFFYKWSIESLIILRTMMLEKER